MNNLDQQVNLGQLQSGRFLTHRSKLQEFFVLSTIIVIIPDQNMVVLQNTVRFCNIAFYRMFYTTLPHREDQELVVSNKY